MKKYFLTASCTVSAYTVVDANSLAEAIEIANQRDVRMHLNGSGIHLEDEWCVEGIDGDPENIECEEEE